MGRAEARCLKLGMSARNRPLLCPSSLEPWFNPYTGLLYLDPSMRLKERFVTLALGCLTSELTPASLYSLAFS